MFSGANVVMPAFHRPFLSTGRTSPRFTETITPRAEVSPIIAVSPGLPAPHQAAIISASVPAALGPQILFIRGFGGDDRSLRRFENEPETDFSLAV